MDNFHVDVVFGKEEHKELLSEFTDFPPNSGTNGV